MVDSKREIEKMLNRMKCVLYLLALTFLPARVKKIGKREGRENTRNLIWKLSLKKDRISNSIGVGNA